MGTLARRAHKPRGSTPDVGEIVGERYRVVGKLGQGSMGVVLHARDEQLEREVAIKLIRQEWAADAESAESFLTEARAMARVDHPNVVKIYDFGWTKHGPFFVMEYIEGIDLLDWLHQRIATPPSVDEALGIINEICRGVQAIHDAGALHRDLKPSNVMVTKGHRIVVTDLGLAFLATPDDETLNAAGSPGYVAPEVIDALALPAELWPRTDIYALGIISYELLTGQAAFWGKDATSVLNAQLTGDPRPINEARPDVDPALDSVIRLALARDPLQRIGSVDAFRRSLIEARRRAADPRAGRRVVIADDEPACRRLIEKSLQREFPAVTLASVDNGSAALRSVNETRTNLLITDLNMPQLGGEELIRNIRRNPRLRSMAILVTTGEGGAKEWERLRNLGADGILLKPVDPVPLVALVKSLLHKPTRTRATR